MRACLLPLVLAGATGCNCGTQVLERPECEVNPEAPGCQPAPPPQQHPSPPPPTECGIGTVTGVVCAPDLMTTVSGADVSVSGVCDGKSFTVTGTTNAQGEYTLTVPAGTWTLSFSSGSFMDSVSVTVKANATTNVPVNADDCFKPTTNLAVINGSGDQIENLLTQIGFTPTIIDGSESGFDGASGGLQFLEDPTQLAKYNVIFIDCGAGRTEESYPDGGTSYAEFQFGSQASTIQKNLQEYVKNGGSLYASDWAFIYIYLAYGQEFEWETTKGSTTPGSVTFPFDPYDLLGAPDQTVMGDVVDTGLAAYLGTSTVTITFPSNMDHWGLFSAINAPAEPLITAAVGACANPNECSCPHSGSCSSVAGPVNTVPLAGLYRVTSGPGGAVAYTSFHNINQADPAEVETILKYLIFKL